MFDHERLDVYQVSLQFVAWVFDRINRLKGYCRHARDKLIRAFQSIPRNIAESNGKRSRTDRRRFFEIARGSALECAAVLDELYVMRVFDASETKEGKIFLHRIVVLTKMTKPVHEVREKSSEYTPVAEMKRTKEIDYDYAHEHE